MHRLQYHSCNFCDYSSSTIREFTTHLISKHQCIIKEDDNTIVGSGEYPLVQILKERLSDVIVFTQVHLNCLVPAEETREFSERQTKETVDVLIIYKNKFIIFRVQHGVNQKYHPKGHLGEKLTQTDLIQKTLIQRYHDNHSVIDLSKSQCQTLFSDKNNWYSQSEVGIQCYLEGLQL